MQYLHDYGVAEMKKYKYANKKQKCMRKQFPSVMNATKICEKNLQGDEEALKSLVATRPVGVTYDATENFMYYKSGIFTDPTCGTTIDHAMVNSVIMPCKHS